MAAQPISMPNEPHVEIKALIDKALGGFNSKDSALYSNAFGGDIVIVDGMAPYRWTGPNAQSRWFADAEKWAHDLGVAEENIAYDRIVRADVVDTHAYVVLSANLSFTLKGQRASRLGILTFTLAKQGEEWKIESQAWGRLS
jgi:ketosteroid isomerase-like protein